MLKKCEKFKMKSRGLVEIQVSKLNGPQHEKTCLRGVCEQHRRRPACASAQSDQRLCNSRIRKYHTSACYKRNFIFLARLCSWGDWFESHFVRNPEDRFCRDESQITQCTTMNETHSRIHKVFSEGQSKVLRFFSHHNLQRGSVVHTYIPK